MHFIIILLFCITCTSVFEKFTSHLCHKGLERRWRVFISLNPWPFYTFSSRLGDKFSWLVIDEFIIDSLAHNTPIYSWGSALPKCCWCLARNVHVATVLGCPCALLSWTMLQSLDVNSNRRLSLLLATTGGASEKGWYHTVGLINL